MKKKLKVQYIKITLFILLLPILFVSMYMGFCKLILGIEVPTLFGCASAIIVSGSMEPALQINDWIMAKSCNTYQVDDIILFKQDEVYITHRIVALHDGVLTTRGDANNIPDKKPVRMEQVVGKVVYVIPHVGNWISRVYSPLGILLIMGTGLGIYVFSVQKNKRAQKAGYEES